MTTVLLILLNVDGTAIDKTSAMGDWVTVVVCLVVAGKQYIERHCATLSDIARQTIQT